MTTSSAFVREFLETLTHVYLHTRKLYPENTFVRRVAYGRFHITYYALLLPTLIYPLYIPIFLYSIAGLQLRFCDYIDVAKYVEAVLDNACPLLDQVGTGLTQLALQYSTYMCRLFRP